MGCLSVIGYRIPPPPTPPPRTIVTPPAKKIHRLPVKGEKTRRSNGGGRGGKPI